MNICPTALIKFKRRSTCVKANKQCRVLNPCYHIIFTSTFESQEFIKLKSNDTKISTTNRFYNALAYNICKLKLYLVLRTKAL